jgi:hypothetical protein
MASTYLDNDFELVLSELLSIEKLNGRKDMST